MSGGIHIKPSRRLQLKVAKVAIAIFIFTISYVVILLISMGLFAGLAFTGILIIVIHPSIVSYVFGLGFILLGLMMFLFLFKVIFTKKKKIETSMSRIYQDDHPRLFRIVESLSEEIGTKLPHKVFLDYDTSTLVFYNSGFASLFFPARKNLSIGLGLINALNVGELKAVLSHEFGHFSQKSMRLGSYIYHINKAIHNLVFDYDEWDLTMEVWLKRGGFTRLFANVTVWTVELLRAAFKESYFIVNRTYMDLSREMELHADDFSVAIVGKEACISALRNSRMADMAFAETMKVMEWLIGMQQRSINIYDVQKFMMKQDPINQQPEQSMNPPGITQDDVGEQRVIYKDIWSPHPTDEERIMNFERRTGGDKNYETGSAMGLLNDNNQLQERFTERLYEAQSIEIVNYTKLDKSTIESMIDDYIQKPGISSVYKGFYDNRFLSGHIPKSEEKEVCNEFSILKFEEIYNDEAKQLFVKIQNCREDILILQGIKTKEIRTQYFNFGNHRYKRKDADKIILKINQELKGLLSEADGIDKKAYCFNLNISLRNGDIAHQDYLIHYESILKCQQFINENATFMDKMSKYHEIIYSHQRFDESESMQINRDLSKIEQNYKSSIRKNKIQEISTLDKDQIEFLRNYLSTSFSYLKISTFELEGFNEFHRMIYSVHDILESHHFTLLKQLTDFQIEMYSKRGLL